MGRFEPSDEVFTNLAAKLLTAVRDIHAMSTFHITGLLTLHNFVLVDGGKQLLLSSVPWGDDCPETQAASEEYEVRRLSVHLFFGWSIGSVLSRSGARSDA